MSWKSVAIVVLALAIIGASVYYVAGGSSRRRPEVSDESKYWVYLAMGGFYHCPHCRERVDLTEEERRQAKPPKLTCPHCGKAVDIVKLMAPKPATRQGAS